jgi:hypothetical protein
MIATGLLLPHLTATTRVDEMKRQMTTVAASDVTTTPIATTNSHPTITDAKGDSSSAPATIIPIKLVDPEGACTVLLLRDATYESLLSEITDTTGEGRAARLLTTMHTRHV